MRFQLQPVFLVLGILLTLLSAALLIPAAVDFHHDNPTWAPFLETSMISCIIGLGLVFSTRGIPKSLNIRQAFLMTVSAWIVISAIAALPLLWSGAVPHYTDAYFEAISGVTTTGATVIPDLDHVSFGILVWRGMLQWMGGLGIIVMAVAILPMLNIGGMQLFKVEAFDTAEKILPRATQISSALTFVFIFFTALCAFCYLLAGMDIGDALVHSMSTVATGGFSTRNNSMGEFENPAIDIITIIFMILGSLPFLLYVRMMTIDKWSLVRDSQVRVFFSMLASFIFLAWLFQTINGSNEGWDRVLKAAFNITSIMTGTGYASDDYTQWGAPATVLFFFVAFCGGCAGSTSCGIKIFRFQVLFQDLRQHVNRIVYPNGIFIKRYNGKPLSDKVSVAVMSLFFVYIATFAVVAVLLSFTGLDFITAVSTSASMVSNVGPGLGSMVGPAGNFVELTDTAKWISSAAMITGRLEFFAVFVLFMPSFWRK